jgi:hypothetical protein
VRLDRDEEAKIINSLPCTLLSGPYSKEIFEGMKNQTEICVVSSLGKGRHIVER